MTTCNATIDVGDQIRRCQSQHGHDRVTKHMAEGARLMWEDGVPGSTPHRARFGVITVDPPGQDRYWEVVDRRGTSESAYVTVVRFYDTHPDARCAARAEAERLNTPPVA